MTKWFHLWGFYSEDDYKDPLAPESFTGNNLPEAKKLANDWEDIDDKYRASPLIKGYSSNDYKGKSYKETYKNHASKNDDEFEKRTGRKRV